MTQQTQTAKRREAVNAGVTNLAAKMAHELNNPLDAVLRFVSLAQRKALAGDYSDLDRYLADAQFGLRRMAEVLRELMDIGRETNQILVRNTAVPLVDLIGRVTRTAAALAEPKGVSLVVKSMVGEGVAFDLRVAQVLSNLIKNAVEAAPTGSAVRVTAARREGEGVSMVALTVEDSGAGIPPQILPQLFTPFVTSKAKGEGYGLGLAISRELVVSIGGTLTLENRAEAAGCVATILLPVDEATPPEGGTTGTGAM